MHCLMLLSSRRWVCALSVSVRGRIGELMLSKGARIACPRSPSPAGLIHRSPTPEQSFDIIVYDHAPGEPPSPSPSIARRRTPAALAVGVHSFQGALQPAGRCLLDFRGSYYARSRLLNHLDSEGFSDGFDCWSDRLFHPPRSLLHRRAFGLGLGNRSLRWSSLSCLAEFS